MESLDDVLLEAEEKMSKCVDFLHEQFGGVRTGKASPSLVENVSVLYYGAPTRLRELASISTPEPRLIVINSYDPTALASIEKAILAANIGLTPMNDGRVIRVPIPELSGERRAEMAKLAKRMAEDARIAVRNVRRDANEHIRVLHKDHKITEDDRDQALADIQKSTDEYTRKIDESAASKEKEVMAV